MKTVNAWLGGLLLAASPVLAQVPATANAPATAVAPAATVSPATTAAAEPVFKVPPGWRQRGKQGDDPIYCRKETVTGTRFEKERCLTRSQLRQAEALSRDYGKEILEGTHLCIGEKAWCASGR